MNRISGYAGHQPRCPPPARFMQPEENNCSLMLNRSTKSLSKEEYDRRLNDERGGKNRDVVFCEGPPMRLAMNEMSCAPLAHRAVGDNFVAKVVEKYGDAAVRVETERTVDVALEADIFSFFFGGRPEVGKKKEKVNGHGSGFCVEGGVVLTNAHVVAGADSIYVTFPKGQRQKAVLLGCDEVLDLAVLQLERWCYPCAIPLGYSSSLKAGDWSIVLGNPLGLSNTVTLGIISSLDRSSGETGWDWMRQPLIQTDATVNQGNSGGPLMNELGQVVGIISMRALFGEGIGFAIPIDSVKQALPLLLKRKSVPHAYLGVKMENEKDKDAKGA